MRTAESYVLAALVFAAAFLPFSARAQTLPAATLPATSAPASAAPAADAQVAAKSALADFYHAMCDADPKAPDMLVFTDPQNEKAGRGMANLALAQQRVRLAAVRAFGAPANTLSLGVSEQDRQQFDADLRKATVTFRGTTAEITVPANGTFVLTLAGGAGGGSQWKIDFDKTQARMGPLPKDADLPAITAQSPGLQQRCRRTRRGCRDRRLREETLPVHRRSEDPPPANPPRAADRNPAAVTANGSRRSPLPNAFPMSIMTL